jgi:hypothetical protein
MALSLNLDSESLRPLIEAVVLETIARLQGENLNGRLAYSEEEAAELLGLNRWQLRDLRRAGKITPAQGPGRKVLYPRDVLVRFLAENPWKGD